ncbi:MAG: MAPEG family protein [Pseudomonadota bacterium]
MEILSALPITALYAGILALILLGLSFGTGAARNRSKVSLGDGGNPDLLVAIRRHGNAVEYVPMILLLLALLEANGASPTLLHVLGAGLVVARIAHPLGLSSERMVHPLRIAGAAFTSLIMVVAGGYAIWQSASTLF